MVRLRSLEMSIKSTEVDITDTLFILSIYYSLLSTNTPLCYVRE